MFAKVLYKEVMAQLQLALKGRVMHNFVNHFVITNQSNVLLQNYTKQQMITCKNLAIITYSHMIIVGFLIFI